MLSIISCLGNGVLSYHRKITETGAGTRERAIADLTMWIRWRNVEDLGLWTGNAVEHCRWGLASLPVSSSVSADFFPHLV